MSEMDRRTRGCYDTRSESCRSGGRDLWTNTYRQRCKEEKKKSECDETQQLNMCMCVCVCVRVCVYTSFADHLIARSSNIDKVVLHTRGVGPINDMKQKRHDRVK